MVSLALVMRRVAPATVELESHLMLPPTYHASYHGVKTTASMLFESVSEYGSSVARVDSRTQESQRGRNGLSWFGLIGALHLAADDPYTQKHLKSGGSNRVVERFGRGLAQC